LKGFGENCWGLGGFEGSEKLLVIQRSFWRFREASGGSEKLLEVQRCFWRFREASGDSEKLLEVQRSF
jgi:hypothetical protein